jgi:hypothetical protein
MKKRKIFANASAAGMALASTSAMAAGDYYLKFDGIDGESQATDPEHKEWIIIQSFSVAAHKPGGGDDAPPERVTRPRYAVDGTSLKRAGEREVVQAQPARKLAASEAEGTFSFDGTLPGCKKGTRYKSATLQSESRRTVMEFEGVTIMRCGKADVHFDYQHIKG